MISNKKRSYSSNIDINILIGIFISNIILAALFNIILSKIDGNLIMSNNIFIDIKELLYQFSLPLPTIPIIVALVIITLFSLPIFYVEKHEKELRIRHFCGATRKNLFCFLVRKYCLYILLAYFVCLFSLTEKPNLRFLIVAKVWSVLFVSEIIFSVLIIYYLIRQQLKV